MVSYQELRYRKIQNYLVLLLGVLSVIHLYTSDELGMLGFACTVTAMLGVARAGGLFKTSDWLCTSACFAFLLPFGIHLAVLSVLLGFAVSVLNHLTVCLATNLRRDPFPDVNSSGMMKVLAMVSCKKRGMLDRFAYPAVLADENTLVFDINSGMRGKRMDHSRQCKYVIPSIPILTYVYASLIAVMLLFYQHVIL